MVATSPARDLSRVCPYYHVVPKGFAENIAYREQLLRRTRTDLKFRALAMRMAREDILWWVNSFAFIFEPRTARIIPFITYPFQDEALVEILDAIGYPDPKTAHDLVIEKSRDMGASWMCVTSFTWMWLFHDMNTFLLLSRKEDLVDKADDPKSLFWKIDFLLRGQAGKGGVPNWMRPAGIDVPPYRSAMHLKNPLTGSVLDGESTAATSTTGDRRRAVLLDELSKMAEAESIVKASRDVTRCRVFNFTPEGTGHFSYKVAKNPDFRKLRLHWSIHPEKNPGLYTSVDGVLKILDESYAFPEGYPFVLDGKLRSPWYDNECRRAVSPREIPQELDIDYCGSDSSFFNGTMLDRYVNTHCKPPVEQWTVQRLLEKSDTEFPADFWDRVRNYTARFWVPVRDGKAAQDRKYVMGVDISQGTGASNSCLSVWDLKERAKVAEFSCSWIMPHELPYVARALGRIFAGDESMGAKVIFEQNNGRSFGRVLYNVLGYGNVYFQRDEKTVSHKMRDVPGWSPTPGNKYEILEALREAMHRDHCINRSREAVEECHDYVYGPKGPKHRKSGDEDDPSGAGDAHGDRVIADALAWHLMRDVPQEKSPEPERVPVNCLQARRNAARSEVSRRPW